MQVNQDKIDGDLVRKIKIARGDNVLFKTRHSGPFEKGKFDERHVYITREGAEALIERQVNLVGVDYLSVDRFGDEDYPAHRTLLGNGALILEATDLSGVREGQYNLIAMPLKLSEGDGSPVRAILTK